MLLCGEPSPETKAFICYKKATSLLVKNDWHKEKYVAPLLGKLSVAKH